MGREPVSDMPARPVVVTGLHEAAGFAARAAWSREGLSAALGRHVVKVSVSQNGRFDGPEEGELWGLRRGEARARATAPSPTHTHGCTPQPQPRRAARRCSCVLPRR